ncbi:DUF7660 family protein [Pseudotenacibaculum haliotis]|uniref:DUF7660 domain-containing protein n=1 Tax=Pseudotenacibaculum haliotis TaxID=1862138 RepID=A0ABW5LPZ5_9FLAO
MTKEQFTDELKELCQDLKENPSNWENRTLESYLEALIAYTEDVQGYYDNMKTGTNANIPTWENFLTILKGASVYE